MHPQFKKLSVLLAALTLALAGCGDKQGMNATAGPLAAKVNGDAIEARLIEAELAKAGVKNPAESQDAANRVLNVLLEQRLLMQQARQTGLDKDPDVIRALQAAERQVLAQAYVEKITVNAAKPGDAEIADYYNKHPEMFGERRIYRLQEVMIQVGPDSVEAVKARLGNGANLSELAQWLKSQNIPARGNQSVKAAEQLPPELLARLHPLKDGQAITLEGPQQISILAISGSQSQPLTLEQARPAIERHLLVAKRRELAQAELDKLRAAAKIEFIAPYAETRAAAAHAVSAAKDEPAQGAFDKALSGLK
jgi:EpsD family peptidyl-prolyl cis-trans isomerase